MKRDKPVGVHLVGQHANIADSEALDRLPMHDANVLPHEYLDQDIAEMFPMAEAPPAVSTTECQEGSEWSLTRPTMRRRSHQPAGQ